MTFGSGFRTIGVCAVCALALGAIASVAIGGKKLKTKSDTVEIDGSSMGVIDDGTATARCGGKTRAVSGGFETEIDPDLMGTSAILHIGSLRESKKQWSSSGVNALATDGDLTSYAYCRKQKKVKSKTSFTEVDGASAGGEPGDGTVTAKCKKGQTALSGGSESETVDLEAPDTTAILPYESRKQGKRKWTASGINIGDTEGDFLGQVICHERKALKPREAEDTVNASATTAGVDDISVKCGKKRRVVSGGFSSEEPFDSTTGSLGLVFASHKQGNRWNISALATQEDHDFTVYAYCEKKKKKKK